MSNTEEVTQDEVAATLYSLEFETCDKALRLISASALGVTSGDATVDEGLRNGPNEKITAKKLADFIKRTNNDFFVGHPSNKNILQADPKASQYLNILSARIAPLCRMSPLPLRHLGRCVVTAACIFLCKPEVMEITNADSIERLVISLSRLLVALDEKAPGGSSYSNNSSSKKNNSKGGRKNANTNNTVDVEEGTATVSPALEALRKATVCVAFMGQRAILDNKVPSSLQELRALEAESNPAAIEERSKLTDDEKKTLDNAQTAKLAELRLQHDTAAKALQSILTTPYAADTLLSLNALGGEQKLSHMAVTSSNNSAVVNYVGPLAIASSFIGGCVIWAPVVMPEYKNTIPYFGHLPAHSEWIRWAATLLVAIVGLGFLFFLAVRRTDSETEIRSAYVQAYLATDGDIKALFDKYNTTTNAAPKSPSSSSSSAAAASSATVSDASTTTEESNADYYYAQNDSLARDLVEKGVTVQLKEGDFDECADLYAYDEDDTADDDEAAVFGLAQTLNVEPTDAADMLDALYFAHDVCEAAEASENKNSSNSNNKKNNKNDAADILNIPESLLPVLHSLKNALEAKGQTDPAKPVAEKIETIEKLLATGKAVLIAEQSNGTTDE